MLFLQSCNNEALDLDNDLEDIELREGNLSERKGCFELVYPLEIILPDESIITVEDVKDFHTQIKAWYVLNPDVKDRPSLNYPIQVTFNGNKSKIVENEEQMMRLKRHCSDKAPKDRDFCFKLIYPLTYLMPDGTFISGANELEIRTQIKEWYASNQATDVKPTLSYPVSVKVKGGDVIIINSEDEMIALKKKCSKRDKVDCFKMDYPIRFTMPDGSVLSVNDEDDMNSSIKNWYQTNPDTDKKPDLIYPVDVILENGKVWTIKNEEEMIKLKKRCDSK
jgi:hypothetical protein